MRYFPLVLSLLLFSGLAVAQQSGSYRLTEHTFNAGGHPADGVTPGSTNFSISLDAVGEGAVREGLNSSSYRMDGSFAFHYPPPGETRGVLFTDKNSFEWSPERSVGVYNVYRGLISELDLLDYGDCLEADVPTTSWMDNDSVPEQDGYFYLVTAENRLAEEGVSGFDSGGTERPNPVPCP